MNTDENLLATTVDVICDLRLLNANVNDVGSLEQLWQRVGGQLIEKELKPTEQINLSLPEGKIVLWIVDPHGMVRTKAETAFRVLDVVRTPKLVYQCIACHEYGPLRCTVCDELKRDTRLCADHAYTIKDELRAYCPEHLPRCECQPGCGATASFRCRRCHRLFGDHYHRQHPNDPTVDYCHMCYRLLFERCAAPGCRNLGRSKCAFQTRAMSEPCGKPLCPEHGFQWKIWGPHNRGIALCELHKNLMASTDPSDLLYMMLNACPPYVGRGRRASLPNPFRLRRILNRNRPVPLTFDQIGKSLQSLESEIHNWNKHAADNYHKFAKSYRDTVGNLGTREAELLTQIRKFYGQELGWHAEQQITALEITDCFFRPGQSPRYRVRLVLNTTNKRAFVGKEGVTVKKLEQTLNLQVDIE